METSKVGSRSYNVMWYSFVEMNVQLNVPYNMWIEGHWES